MMDRTEIEELRTKHQPYMSQRGKAWQNCEACSTGREMSGGIGWPCLIVRLLDAVDDEKRYADTLGDALARTDEMVARLSEVIVEARAQMSERYGLLEDFRELSAILAAPLPEPEPTKEGK